MLLSVPGDGSITGQWKPLPDTPFFQAIPFSSCGFQDSFLNGAACSLSPGLNTIQGIPVDLTAPVNSLYIGLAGCQDHRMIYYGNVCCRRNAFDGIQEHLVFSVSKRQYAYAHLVYTVEESAGKLPCFTVRLTRFDAAGRGDTFADTYVYHTPQPGEAFYNPLKIGNITFKNGKKSDLYYLQIPLHMGEIQDLFTNDKKGIWGNGDYLDLELARTVTGQTTRDWGLEAPEAACAYNKFINIGPQSSIHLLGLTLEESPVTMVCENSASHTGNVFLPGEKPGLNLVLFNHKPVMENYQIEWIIKNFSGLESIQSTVIPLPPHREKVYPLSLAVPEPGWYGVRVAVSDNTVRKLVSHTTAVALVPEQMRLPGSESPFGTWWWMGSHYTTNDITTIGPLFLKAGLRRFRMHPLHPTLDLTEKDLLPYQGTLAALRWQANPTLIPLSFESGLGKKEIDKIQEKQINAELADIKKIIDRFPNCKLGTVLHEDHLPAAQFVPYIKGKNQWFPFPPELLDRQSELFLPQYMEMEEIFNRYYC